MTDTQQALYAYEILTPNMECEIHGAEGSEAVEMQQLWDIIGTALHSVDVWQPIETAPRDGTCFLAIIPDFGDNVMMICAKTIVKTVGDQDIPYTGFVLDNHWSTAFDSHDEVEPTHWQPLPQPPQHGIT